MPERSVTHATFVVERDYAAAPARVFAAWSDPAAKAKWFLRAEGWEVDVYELDFRVGGEEHFRGRPEGGPLITNRTTYEDIVTDERIVYTYEMRIDDVRISVSLTTVELAPASGGTRLTLTEYGAFLDGHEDPIQRETGVGSLLDALGAELRGG